MLDALGRGSVPSAGGGAITLSIACPLIPSLVAVMVVLPAALVEIIPAALIEATVLFELCQVMLRPLTTFPAASRRVAVAELASPTTTDEGLRATETDATGAGSGGAVTFSVARPVIPSLVAVMLALPTPMAVMAPAPLTVAIAVFELCQLMMRPDRRFPAASRSVALATPVWPTTTDDGVSETEMEAIGTGAGAVTVSVVCPLMPSLIAVMLVFPAAAATI
ncbi:MAG TPA: hypothetical protein VJU87_05325 [Gemmatimonadaceae bacterium]|nr:hypothetical protein [Gemmatimonadaceae bacterium]